MSLPLTGWPAEVLEDLHDVVDDIANNDRVAAFKIGRTNSPRDRFNEYGQEYSELPTKLVPIYQTTSEAHVLEVEDELIKAWYEHPKCLNEAEHSGGSIAKGDVQYVYVAYWSSR